jgi:RimJ/RimL family protein N-acetyltransferase
MRPKTMVIDPPEIISLERLRLRRPEFSDAEAIFGYASDSEVTRYMDWPRCQTLKSIVEALSHRAKEWESGSAFNWLITLPPDDVVIGSVSCAFKGHSVEYGYLLNRSFWGRGFATEVSKAIVEWALSEPSIWRVWATCDIDNSASSRVLEKSGLAREGILRRSIVRPNISGEPRDAYLYSKVRV